MTVLREMSDRSSTVLPVEDHIKLLVFGEAHKVPCDSCTVSELEHALPPWYDKAKYKRGQSYIRRNFVGHVTATLCGVITVFAVPSGLTILMKTHRSSTPYSAYRRYLSTIMHFQSWYKEDLEPGSDAWKSLSTVRERHIKWSNVSKLRKDGHISQRDLVLTLTAFGGVSLVRPHLLGMEHDNREDLEAFAHFWRTIGHMLGIEDRYNTFRPSLDETLLVTEAIITGIYKPLIQNPPEYFYHMASTFIQGLWFIDPTLTVGTMNYFNYRLLGVEGFEYNPKGALEIKQKKEIKIRESQLKNINFRKGVGYSEYPGKDEEPLVTGDKFYMTLGLYNRIVLFIMVFWFNNVVSTTVGKVIGLLKGGMTLVLVKFFPILFMIRFGFKGAYVNKYEEDIKIEARIKTNKEMLAEMRN